MRIGIRTILAVGALAALGHVPSAAACGGLFCSASAPVEQTAERILFADNGDGTTTSIIEIQYEGPSEKFAWLLPIPGVPLVSVSSSGVFDALEFQTNPVYRVRGIYNANCALSYYGDEGSADGDDLVSDAGADPNSGITVLDSGIAGPYEHVTIAADADLPDPAEAAVRWLEDNDYDVGSTGADALRPYLEEGLNLIAFKLTKGQSVGAIRPIWLSYEGAPTIPLRPTAEAAVDDMGIRVFLLGDYRGLSRNYLGVELNPARFDWRNWRAGYDSLVSDAVDQAGGQAFVTEFAGDASQFKEQVFTRYELSEWAYLSAADLHGASLLQEAAFVFQRYEGYRRAVEAAVTLPAGVTIDEFASNPFGYETGDAGADGAVAIDDKVFLDTLEAEVIEPLQAAQALVDDHAVLSRLYTTLSPDEMRLGDPTFEFIQDLPDVSNELRADLDYLCAPDESEQDARTLLTLDNGWGVPGRGGESLPAVAELPAARVIYAAGGLMAVEDNSELIGAALADLVEENNILEFAEVDAPDGDATGADDDAVGSGDDAVGSGDDAVGSNNDGPALQESDDASTDSGVPDGAGSVASNSHRDRGGCSVGSPGSGQAPRWGVWALLGLLVATRRRRA